VVHERTVTVEKPVPYPVPYLVEKTVYIDEPEPAPIVGGVLETDVYYETGALTSPLLPPSTVVTSPLLPSATVVTSPLLPPVETVVVEDVAPIVAAPVVAGTTMFAGSTIVPGAPTVVSRTVERRDLWIEPGMPAPLIAPTVVSTVLAPAPPIIPPYVPGKNRSSSAGKKKNGKLSRLLHRRSRN
jgi:hypothetical protein